MPKPIFGINGSGMHTHQSLYDLKAGRNAFHDPENRYGLSDVARAYMAGILAHARGMIAVLAPLVNSYKRLVPGYEAPTYLTWGRINRSALIRVPQVSPGRAADATRVEVRCPDPSSNPYLAFAVMLAAGLDGIEKGMELGEPVEESLYEMDSVRIRERGIRELPGTLAEAVDELEADTVIGEALGDHILSRFVESRRADWDEYRTQVTPWEVERYLEDY
jgi:glutamine synthetase